MNRICIVTASRAEYGIMKNLIQKFQSNSFFDVKVVVTGTHLSQMYGLTYREIEQDGIEIDEKIDILSSEDTHIGVTETMANCMKKFSKYFSEKRPDFLLVLGDRYEIMAVCIAAMITNVAIAHIHGGETTEGAIDECIRHSITKMSYLHFTSTEVYRRRVIQLGETPNRVYCVGSLGVENVLCQRLLSQSELSMQLDFDLMMPYAIVTYHPTTLGEKEMDETVRELLAALDRIPQLNYIISKANADVGGSKINALIEDYGTKHSNIKVFSSLGMLRYLSALKYAELVIGNSSSGIIEAPSFHIPTVNIGTRQRGRLQAQSVINVSENRQEIVEGIVKAMDMKRSGLLNDILNPYEGTQTSCQIVEVMKETMMNGTVDLKKKFYDIEL